MLKLKGYARGLVGIKEQVSMSSITELRINSRSAILVEGGEVEVATFDKLTEYPFINRLIELIYGAAPNLELYVSVLKDPESIGMRDIMLPDLTRDGKGSYDNVLTLLTLTGGLGGPEARFHKRISPLEELVRNALYNGHFRAFNDVDSRVSGLYVPGLTELLAHHYAVGSARFLSGPSTLPDLYENLSELLGFPIREDVWNAATGDLSEKGCKWEIIYAIGVWMLSTCAGEYLLEAFEAALSTSKHQDVVGPESRLGEVELSLNVQDKLDRLLSDNTERQWSEIYGKNNIFKTNECL